MAGGRFMWDRPRYYYANDDPSVRFDNNKEAQEYAAQLAIKKARSVPSLDDTKSLGKIGDGTVPPSDNTAPFSVESVAAPGSPIGQTQAWRDAFKYEQDQKAAKEMEEEEARQKQKYDLLADKLVTLTEDLGAEDSDNIRIKLASLMESSGLTKDAMEQVLLYADEKSKEKIKGSEFGRSSVGAALAYTKSPDGQAQLERVNSTINSLKAEGIYNNDLLNSIASQAQGDVRQANNVLSSLMSSTAKAVRTIEETMPGKIRTAAGTSAASTGARIQKESELAGTSAETAGIIAGGKEAGKREAGITLTASSAERLGDFQASLSQLSVLSDSFSNPDAPQGPIAQIRKVNPYDWEAQAKQQLVAATKQLVGKALEGGVLRAEDERKYEKILPKIGDTYRTAAQKAKNLNTMLNNAYVARVGALEKAGYAVESFKEKKQAQKTTGPKIPPDVLKQAQEALNDPDAPEEVKAKAREILGK